MQSSARLTWPRLTLATTAATAGASALILAATATEPAPPPPAPTPPPPQTNGRASATTTMSSLDKIDKESPDLAWWRDSMKTHEQRIAWWRQARFGMFIHWGVYSTLGGTWDGQPLQGYSEHIMRRLKIPREQYKTDVAGQFNPVNFDAAEWAKLAKDAGMGYMVITSKHHDGFAMFDSEVSDYNVVKATPWHHDPMKDLKAACQKQGIHFGFYYSQAFDWEHPDAAGNDWDYDNPGGDKGLHGGKQGWWHQEPQLLPKIQKYLDQKCLPQVKELVVKYHPDIIWFDTPSKMPPVQNLQVLKALREVGPDVVANSRCVATLGDYQSTADRPAEFPPHDGDWEGIPTTNESYGYNQNDHSHKPPSHFIQLLAKASARGGNLMLNFGPRGDGTFDPADVAILKGIAAWMNVNAESIHGTDRTPLPVQAWGESTRKGNTLYLHVFNWPADGKLIVGGLKSGVAKAYVLNDSGRSPLTVQRLNDKDLALDVPKDAPDQADSVVVVQCDGDIETDATRLLSATRPNELRVFDGKLKGDKIKFGQGKKENAYVEQWSEPDASVTWNLRAPAPGQYNVAITYDALQASDGGVYAVQIDNKPLSGTVQAGKEQTQRLGHIDLDTGNLTVSVVATQIKGQELMCLRSVTLTPVK
jgi:alpha-L-fucosidase